jgi:hypothetical protein
MAAFLFLFLAASEEIAYLLNAFPSSELLWRLAIWSNRAVGHFLSVADNYVPAPYQLPVVLLTAVLLPAISYKRRSWFGTAACGHIALGSTLLLSLDAFNRARVGHDVASLDFVLDHAIFNYNLVTFVTLSAVLAALCVLNHILFIDRVRQRRTARASIKRTP